MTYVTYDFVSNILLIKCSRLVFDKGLIVSVFSCVIKYNIFIHQSVYYLEYVIKKQLENQASINMANYPKVSH